MISPLRDDPIAGMYVLPIAMPPVMEPFDTGVRASIMQEPCNVDRSLEQPAAIVTARKPRGRKAAWVDDGAETPESMKKFLARMIRPGGSLPPTPQNDRPADPAPSLA